MQVLRTVSLAGALLASLPGCAPSERPVWVEGGLLNRGRVFVGVLEILSPSPGAHYQAVTAMKEVTRHAVVEVPAGEACGVVVMLATDPRWTRLSDVHVQIAQDDIRILVRVLAYALPHQMDYTYGFVGSQGVLPALEEGDYDVLLGGTLIGRMRAVPQRRPKRGGAAACAPDPPSQQSLTGEDRTPLPRAVEPDAPVPVLRADHPSIFFIRHNKTSVILFLGRVADPNG